MYTFNAALLRPAYPANKATPASLITFVFPFSAADSDKSITSRHNLAHANGTSVSSLSAD